MNLVCRLLLEKNFFNDTATTEIYTLSLHDALPISFRNKAAPGTGTLRKTETRRFPRRVSLPGTERFAFEHICRPDPVFRLAGFTLPPEQPQVNCGDTGEGELRDAPGRQREARYGQGERRGISPCPAPWSTS